MPPLEPEQLMEAQVKKRWLENMIKAAAEKDVALPWQRGALRSETVPSRQSDTEQKAVSA